MSQDFKASFEQALALLSRAEDAEVGWQEVIAAIRSLEARAAGVHPDSGRGAIMQHLKRAELAAGNRDVARAAHHLRVAARHLA